MLARLRRGGSVDAGFGGGTVLLPFSQRPALAVDDRGRALLAGDEKRRKDHWSFVLGRRTRDGRRDPAFGSGGWARAGFDGFVSAAQVLVGGGGRIVVGGPLWRGKRYGIALARFHAH